MRKCFFMILVFVMIMTLTACSDSKHTIDFHINCSGRASYKTNEIDVDSEYMASTKVFLTEFQDIEINKEIPVAIMVYDSGTSMRSYSLQDYFEPLEFNGMDLVQVEIIGYVK